MGSKVSMRAILPKRVLALGIWHEITFLEAVHIRTRIIGQKVHTAVRTRQEKARQGEEEKSTVEYGLPSSEKEGLTGGMTELVAQY